VESAVRSSGLNSFSDIRTQDDPNPRSLTTMYWISWNVILQHKRKLSYGVCNAFHSYTHIGIWYLYSFSTANCEQNGILTGIYIVHVLRVTRTR